MTTDMLARGCKARTFWESFRGGRRLVREWVLAGRVEGFEVVCVERAWS